MSVMITILNTYGSYKVNSTPNDQMVSSTWVRPRIRQSGQAPHQPAQLPWLSLGSNQEAVLEDRNASHGQRLRDLCHRLELYWRDAT